MLSIFNQYVDAPVLDQDQERELILASQYSCSESFETLLKAYAPLLKKFAHNAPSHVESDDVQGALLLGFTEAVNVFDPEKHQRLAAVLPDQLRRSLSDIGVSASSFSIPTRSLSRWLQIYRKADNNVYEAVALAPEFSMSKETFMAIYSALRATNSLEALLIGDEFVVRSIHIETAEPTGESDTELCQLVFASKGDEHDLTTREAEVLRRSYGFMSYGEPLTDDAVGEAVGLSRASAQRIRNCALDKARARLGVGV